MAEFGGELLDCCDAGGRVGCVQDRLNQRGRPITPSAKPATQAACAASEIPIPTQTGSSVIALTRWTRELAAALTLSRTPVTPISDEA
jgi:hypothetical protein